MKKLIKKTLSILFNNFKLLRIKKRRFSSIIGRGLVINGRFREKIAIGKNVSIGRCCRLGNTFEEGNGIVLGDNCYIQDYFTAIDGNITIHNNCLIASNVSIFGANHSIDIEDKFQTMIRGDVEIGEYTWIGEKAIILPNVTIGNNCIIGAGSVVTKSIPPYSIAVGNPAKVVKKYDMETKEWKKI